MRDAREEPRQPSDDNERDLELLEGSIRGDRQAFHALYSKYYHPLLRFTYRITGQLELAQEALNDAMLVIWERGSSFGGRARLATWIMGIAYRKALKTLEKSRRWTERVSRIDIDSLDEPSMARGEPMRDTDLEDALAQAMNALPAKHRAVVELAYYYGYSYEEIAVITECPVNTVKTRMFHARAKLKAMLPRLGIQESDA